MSGEHMRLPCAGRELEGERKSARSKALKREELFRQPHRLSPTTATKPRARRAADQLCENLIVNSRQIGARFATDRPSVISCSRESLPLNPRDFPSMYSRTCSPRHPACVTVPVCEVATQALIKWPSRRPSSLDKI